MQLSKDKLLEQFSETWGYVEDCCLHNPAFQLEDVDEVLVGVCTEATGDADHPLIESTVNQDDQVSCNRALYEGLGTWSDNTSAAIVRLKDGRIGYFEEGEDYTGHGCQCSSYAKVFDSLNEALVNGPNYDWCGFTEYFKEVLQGS